MDPIFYSPSNGIPPNLPSESKLATYMVRAPQVFKIPTLQRHTTSFSFITLATITFSTLPFINTRPHSLQHCILKNTIERFWLRLCTFLVILLAFLLPFAKQSRQNDAYGISSGLSKLALDRVQVHGHLHHFNLIFMSACERRTND